MRLEGLRKLKKKTFKPSGFEPATFRFAEWCLNRLRCNFKTEDGSCTAFGARKSLMFPDDSHAPYSEVMCSVRKQENPRTSLSAYKTTPNISIRSGHSCAAWR
jgi:hypothetical protein